MTFLMTVIIIIAIYDDDANLYSKSSQASGLLQ